MNNKMKKGIMVVAIIFALGGSTVVSAANDFKFCIVSNVIGKKEFKLKNKYTNCVSNASTYRYNTDNKVDFVGRYAVDLDGNGFFNKDYDGVYKKANGKSYKTSYGIIDKNTYTVNVGVDRECNLGPKCGQIKGTGELVQAK